MFLLGLACFLAGTFDNDDAHFVMSAAGAVLIFSAHFIARRIAGGYVQLNALIHREFTEFLRRLREKA